MNREFINLIFVLLICSLLACASTKPLPDDVASLQQELTSIRRQLDEAEADLSTALNLLQDCESINAK